MTDSSIHSAAFSPASTYIASSYYNKRKFHTVLWDLATKTACIQWISPGEVHALEFSPDGVWLAAGSNKKKSNFHIQNLLKMQGRTLTAHIGGVTGLSYSTCGNYLVSGGLDKTLRVWRTPEMNEYRVFDEATWTAPSRS